MSYVSDHALYGLGATETYGSYLQTQANVAAGYLGLAKIAVDGVPGTKTLALLNSIADKTKSLGQAALGPPLNVNDMKANAKSIGDFIRLAVVPGIKAAQAASRSALMPTTAQSVTFPEMNIIGKVPAATADKTASTAQSYTPAAVPAAKAPASPSFFQSKIFGVPAWVLLAGGGALAFMLMRGKKSAPAPAAVVAPTVPKGA